MIPALVRVFAGLAGTLALRALDLFPTLEILSSTIEVVPLTAGLLTAARRLGTGDTRTKTRDGLALAAVTGAILAAVALDQTGFRYWEVLGSRVIFLGLLGILAWRVALGLSALKNPLQPHRRASFFLIVLGVYAAIAPWSTVQRPPDGDEPYYLLISHSIAYDLDTDLANNYLRSDSLAFLPRALEPQPNDPVGPNGEQFSRHNMLLPLLMAPFYRLAGLPGALGFMALLTAALATMILRVNDLYFPDHPRASLIAASITAFSSPLLLLSYQVWAEVPAALLVAIAFEATTRLKVNPSSSRNLAKLVAAVVLLPLLKLRFLALALPILALNVAGAPRERRSSLLRGLTILLGVATAILLFNEVSFGRPLKHHSVRSLLNYLTAPQDYLAAPLGLFLDSSFGLFFSAPIWILVLPGIWTSLRKHRTLLVNSVVICAPYLLLLGPRREWFGGWSPFFRYGICFLPFLAAFLVPILARRRLLEARFLIAFLAGLTICVTVVWLGVPGWTFNFADGRGYLLDHLTERFGVDIARLFPSFVRPRRANLFWLALMLLPFLALRSTKTSSRSSLASATAALLLASATVPLVAAKIPTSRIEFEDPYVEKTGGRVWPDRWVQGRVRFRGSWELAPGDEVATSVRAAGRTLDLAINLRRRGRLRAETSLEILANGESLLVLPLPRAKTWSTVRLGPIEWPENADTLRLRMVGVGGRVLLDYAQLDWR